PAGEFNSRPVPTRKFAPGSTLLRAGRQRRSVRLDLFRSALHAACAIDRLKRPLGSLLRESSRQTVDFGRPIAWAIAPIEWPKALARPICSLSSSDKCE